MRILVISNSEWDDSTSFGNTFTNIFSGVTDIEIANIFCRSGIPNTVISDKFLSITDRNMLKSIFKRKFDPAVKVENAYGKNKDLTRTNKGIVKFARKKRWAVFFTLREILWSLGNYKKSNFINFVKDFNPDIIFLPTYIYCYINKMGMYLQKMLSCPVVSYMGDNIYSLKRVSFDPLFWINRFHQRRIILKTLRKSQKIYVSTSVQQKELKEKFNLESSVLVKSADFSSVPQYKTNYGKEYNFTYTGTLGNGRVKGLIAVAKALQNLSKDGINGVLHVYSLTPLSKKTYKKLLYTGHVVIFDPVAYEYLYEVYDKADVLVFSEPMGKVESLQSMGSFSTKLVGYMHSARCIYAIGYNDLASIKHISNYAYVSKGEKFVEEELKQLLNFEILDKYARLAWECGAKYHDININSKQLEQDLIKVKK